MTKDIDSKLNKILDISTDIKKETEVIQLPAKVENMETDYRYTRENLYSLVERG